MVPGSSRSWGRRSTLCRTALLLAEGSMGSLKRAGAARTAADSWSSISATAKTAVTAIVAMRLQAARALVSYVGSLAVRRSSKSEGADNPLKPTN